MSKIIRIIPLALCLAFVSCGGPGNSGSTSEAGEEAIAEEEAPATLRSFPTTAVPMMLSTDSEETTSYIIDHYWDDFFAGDGTTDNQSILGVQDGDVEQALANYLAILQMRKDLATPDNLQPLRQAQRGVGSLFSKIERKQKEEPSSHVYQRMTEMVSRYLYDPNSPLRDEDLYLPFAESAEKSPCTSDDMRPAYRFEAGACRTNSFGTQVPDIRYCDIKGHKGNLYSVKADYTMLFFSNPGCTACKEIVNEIIARGYTDRYISTGRLAIVNIYIDEEVSKWRDYVPNYPTSWINGYDYTFKLRTSGTYDIRAIPSLYLLDSSKRVLMKDAPTEKVLSYLDKI